MIKVWKIFSFLIVGVVCLAMVLGPSVPVVSALALDCGIEVQPNMTKVGFNEAFSVDIVVNNSAGLPLASEGVYINFTKDLIEVVSITTTGTPFTQVLLPPTFDNNAGTIDQGAGTPPGTNITALAPLVMTINMQSKNAAGTATIQFVSIVPTRVTKVFHEMAGNILDWNYVVNGTVMVGCNLTVNVTPADKGDVKVAGVTPASYPNTTTRSWDAVVTLEAVNSTPGWGFVDWTGDLIGNTTPTSVTMNTSTRNVTANFAEQPPAISVSPSPLTLTVAPDATGNTTYAVTNSGGGTLSWNSSNVTYGAGAADWLTQNITSGNLTANVSDTVLVTANATGLTEGTTYNATINITGNSSVPLSVTLTVGVPAISVSPTSLSFTTTDGENPADQTLEVWNSGSATLNWTLTDDAGWLSESPTSGNSTGVNDKTSVTVSVDVTGLGVGDYSGTITITAPGATNTPQSVSVSLHIEAAAAGIGIPGAPEVPVIEVEPASLSASSLSISPQQVQPDQEVTISISVANTGGKTGSYNAVLHINGVVEDSQSVSVAGGTSKNVIFTVSKSQAGVYDVTLAGQNGQFEVVGGGGWFGGGLELGTGGIVAIVVIVIALIVALIFILRGTTRPE